MWVRDAISKGLKENTQKGIYSDPKSLSAFSPGDARRSGP